ncbi:MAG: hypothetical protein ACO3XO_03370 [Bdellovibrionota bacterium]|jgi:hypothetical protein
MYEMEYLQWIHRVLCACIFGLVALSASAEEYQQQFFRISQEEGIGGFKGKALQVAVAEYLLAGGSTVSLVGAVHVGDASYYDKLNDLLADSDYVLYELVGPPGVKPQPLQASGGLLNAIQRGFARMLHASHQLDKIDYSPSSFIHADVSPADIVKEALRRGDSLPLVLGKVFLDLFLSSRISQSEPRSDLNIPELLTLYLDVSARRDVIAQSLVDFSGSLARSGLGALEYYLIDFRNERVLTVLKNVLRVQPSPRQIAIFYGAGHMADLESRIVRELGGQLLRVRWITAWQL